jgi:hypothetical protein
LEVLTVKQKTCIIADIRILVKTDLLLRLVTDNAMGGLIDSVVCKVVSIRPIIVSLLFLDAEQGKLLNMNEMILIVTKGRYQQ